MSCSTYDAALVGDAFFEALQTPRLSSKMLRTALAASLTSKPLSWVSVLGGPFGRSRFQTGTGDVVEAVPVEAAPVEAAPVEPLPVAAFSSPLADAVVGPSVSYIRNPSLDLLPS